MPARTQKASSQDARSAESTDQRPHLDAKLVRWFVQTNENRLAKRIGQALLDAWKHLGCLKDEREAMADMLTIDTEEELLATLMTYNDSREAAYALKVLQALDFTREAHRILLTALQAAPRMPLTGAVLQATVLTPETLEQLRQRAGFETCRDVWDWLIGWQAHPNLVSVPGFIPWYCERVRARRLRDGAAFIAECVKAGKDNAWCAEQLRRLNRIPKLDKPLRK